MSYAKFQCDLLSGSAAFPEKLMGGCCIPLHGRGLMTLANDSVRAPPKYFKRLIIHILIVGIEYKEFRYSDIIQMDRKFRPADSYPPPPLL